MSVTKQDVTKRLFKKISPKYKDTNGGYTSIVKMGPRSKDAAQMAILNFFVVLKIKKENVSS